MPNLLFSKFTSQLVKGQKTFFLQTLRNRKNFLAETLDQLAMLLIRSPCQKGKNNPPLGKSFLFGMKKGKPFKGAIQVSQKIYEMITNQIIKKLEEGTVPWKKTI
ncbi:hypothetical protein ACE1TI_18760 [Alteribacillus sp. JSM 102045]|uniref:hypothetical protein n=1 Tax=Alteribacillus sp. JSM 102045 TaxID=1562101 RepID=UPI0035C10CDF